jgi:hypothetical protein
MIPIQEIKAPPNWNGWKDLKDFESRFDDKYENANDFALLQVEESYAYLKRVLAHSLFYFLKRKTRHLELPVNALTVAETCHLLLDLTSQSGREPEYKERFKDRLMAVLHYDEQRFLVLKRLWINAAQVWLVELAELADSMTTVAWELDEGMSCEHEDYELAK